MMYVALENVELVVNPETGRAHPADAAISNLNITRFFSKLDWGTLQFIPRPELSFQYPTSLGSANGGVDENSSSCSNRNTVCQAGATSNFVRIDWQGNQYDRNSFRRATSTIATIAKLFAGQMKQAVLKVGNSVNGDSNDASCISTRVLQQTLDETIYRADHMVGSGLDWLDLPAEDADEVPVTIAMATCDAHIRLDHLYCQRMERQIACSIASPHQQTSKADGTTELLFNVGDMVQFQTQGRHGELLQQRAAVCGFVLC